MRLKKERKIGAYKRRLFSCSQVLWFWGCPQVTLHLSQRKGISRSVMSDSLWPHEPQHARPPCPSPTPGVYSNSRPLSRWYHPIMSSSVIPFSSCLQSFPASRSFSMSQFFESSCQSIGASATASVLPMNIQDWFPLGWTGLISLLSKTGVAAYLDEKWNAGKH